VSLKDARDKRDELRQIIKNGEDPAELRKRNKLEAREAVQNTFKNIAVAWLERKQGLVTERQMFSITRRLEMNIFPFLGSVPIKKISPKDLLATIHKVEERGALEMAHRTLQYVGQVFRYAISTGRAEHDITADLRGALIPLKVNHYAYFSEKEFCEFLEDFHEFRGNVLTKLALELLILTFVRSGELRGARWEEFDFEKRQWRIPADRMKMKEQHIVPLSEQTVVVLEKIVKFSSNEGLLFSCRTDVTKPISDNTLSKAFRDQGYRGKATPHGLRATASTILNENGFKPDVIERQLVHCERNKIRASYNHAQYLPERRDMMIWWGEYVGKHMGQSQLGESL
jgi:integrase